MKQLSLRGRMGVSITAVILVVLTIMIALQVRQMANYSRHEAFSKAEEVAHRYANQVAGTLNDALVAARTVAQTFEGLKLAWVDDRSFYNGILNQILTANTNFLAVWSCWEPDALDSKDKDFAGKTGHDETGRFIPLWARAADGKIQLEQLTAYTQAGAGDYYQQARKLGRETLLDPHAVTLAGRSVRVTTLTVPIRYNGEFVGAVGIHLAADRLQDIVAGIRPYESGFAGLVSQNGRYVAHAQPAQLDQPADGGQDGAFLRRVLDGNSASRNVAGIAGQGELYQLFAPVRIGQTPPWSLAVSIPMSRILAEAQRTTWFSILLGIVAVAILLAVVLWLANSIARPLGRLSDTLRQTAGEVEQASLQFRTSSQSLAEGASEQAASLEETSASLEEMASMIRRNAENAQRANALAKEARHAADTGGRDMQTMTAAMQDIKVSSDEIAKIIKAIDEIAFQTNILALNAAVEAARAGEAGMGFAVVADEVRALAQRSATAARETAAKIEAAITKTTQGVQISTRVAEGLGTIIEKIRQVDELVTAVAGASAEQSQGITQVNSAVTQMDKVTQRNAASAEESASAAQELNREAEVMKTAVAELLQLVGGVRVSVEATPAADDFHSAPASSPQPATPARPAPAAFAKPARTAVSSMPPADESFEEFKTLTRA